MPHAHPEQPTGTEPSQPVGKASIQSGPDVEAVQPLDRAPVPDLTNQNGEHAERAPERDEHGRI